MPNMSDLSASRVFDLPIRLSWNSPESFLMWLLVVWGKFGIPKRLGKLFTISGKHQVQVARKTWCRPVNLSNQFSMLLAPLRNKLKTLSLQSLRLLKAVAPLSPQKQAFFDFSSNSLKSRSSWCCSPKKTLLWVALLMPAGLLHQAFPPETFHKCISFLFSNFSSRFWFTNSFEFSRRKLFRHVSASSRREKTSRPLQDKRPLEPFWTGFLSFHFSKFSIFQHAQQPNLCPVAFLI